MTSSSGRDGMRMFWIMALFVVLGVPFVAILWESLNHVLALDFSSRLWIAIPAAVILAGVLVALRRTLDRRTS